MKNSHWLDKGRRVIVSSCSDFETKQYKYKKGSIGTINELLSGSDINDPDYCPFVFFDNKDENYTKNGTAVHIACLNSFYEPPNH